MKKLLFLQILFSLFLVGEFRAQEIIDISRARTSAKTSPVLIDGRLSEDEWADAYSIILLPSTTMYFKQAGGHVFIGVKTRAKTPIYVDLFLLTGKNELFNLHASMQIGERLLSQQNWTDQNPQYLWGNNIDWIANEVKIDSRKSKDLPFSERVFPYDGIEYQIRRSRFTGEQWKLRIEVRDFMGKNDDVILPAKSSRFDPKQWRVLQL